MSAAAGVPTYAAREHAPRRSVAAAAAGSQATATRDSFPHTKRPLPWLLAGFLAMLFFVPIAATELRVHLPVDSHIDRFAIAAIVFAWIWFGGDQRGFLGTRRSKLYVTAACVYLIVAVVSLLFDAPRIINLGDFDLAGKRFALLGSFLVLSWFALTALRFEDVRGFTSYLIGLGTLTAVGLIVERRTGYNVFYNWNAAILKPIASVAPSPTNIHPGFGSDGRVDVVGPTYHGLAAATMLVVVMPFALVRVLDAKARKSWWLNAIAFTVMLAGAAATDRKTALFVPIAVVLYMTFYRPRQVLRLLPIGLIALVGIVHFASPGAIGGLIKPSRSLYSNSTTHRLDDYSAVTPDILAHPVIGRGFGTLEPDAPLTFRTNDNEYLDQIWEVGVLGLLAFAWMILAPVFAAHRMIRARAPAVSSLALAGAGGCIAFFVACALFDALSFPQAPYMFFMIAALTTIAAAGPEGNARPIRELVRGVVRRPRAAAAATT